MKKNFNIYKNITILTSTILATLLTVISINSRTHSYVHINYTSPESNTDLQVFDDNTYNAFYPLFMDFMSDDEKLIISSIQIYTNEYAAPNSKITNDSSEINANSNAKDNSTVLSKKNYVVSTKASEPVVVSVTSTNSDSITQDNITETSDITNINTDATSENFSNMVEDNSALTQTVDNTIPVATASPKTSKTTTFVSAPTQSTNVEIVTSNPTTAASIVTAAPSIVPDNLTSTTHTTASTTTTEAIPTVTDSPVSTGSNNTTTSNTSAPIFSYTVEQQSIINTVLSRLNSLRAGLGLSQLSINPTLANIAQYRAKHMAENNYFSHTYNGTSHYLEVAKLYSFSYSGIAENIACGTYGSDRIADVLMDGWTNSDGHYANMTKDNWTGVGLGAYKSELGMWYLVQIFAR